MTNPVSFSQFILSDVSIDQELLLVLQGIEEAAKSVALEVRQAGLVDYVLGAQGAENVQGEAQQKLDLLADKMFIAAFEKCGAVCAIASEENEHSVEFTSEKAKKAPYLVLFDPLDGSSNIDVNVSIGTIFSIYKRISQAESPVELMDFLQPGTKQVAAGYILYGPSTMFVFSSGTGVNGFTLNPTSNVFSMSHPMMKMPENGRLYAMNEGNINDCDKGLKSYIAYCQSNENDFGAPYSGRYIGSLVADFHRNLIKGGIYIYPAVKAHPEGRLRLLYECNPLAYIAEQAGGLATTGGERILEIIPSALHQRIPYFVGSKNMVEKAMNCLEVNK